MDIQLEAGLLARGGLTSEQLGWLAEQDLDRTLLLGSRGRLQRYIPVVDSRRVDRAYAWDGIGHPWFLQVKGTGASRADSRYSWSIPAAHFTACDRFLVVPCIIDPATGRLLDPVWCVPSDALVRVAGHGFDVATGAVLEITAGPTGHDAMSRYRTILATLWESLPTGQLELPAIPAPHQEQGGFYELSAMVELLRASEDDLLLFRPASDIAGRDLLIQLVDSPKALYLQVKGTARLAERDSIHLLVRRRSFAAAEDFWLGFFYDRQTERSSRTAGWCPPSSSPAGPPSSGTPAR